MKFYIQQMIGDKLHYYGGLKMIEENATKVFNELFSASVHVWTTDKINALKFSKKDVDTVANVLIKNNPKLEIIPV